MAHIIGLVQVKGGSGRSTIATNLAGELSRTGKVVLIDADMPQGTSASWAAIRSKARPNERFLADTATGHRELLQKVEALREKADYIVLDAPPRIAELTRSILLLSDLVLIPVGASAAEIWATGDMVELVNEAKKVGKVDARMLWTRFRSYTRLAQELEAEASKVLKLPQLKAILGYRVAYAEALGLGLTAAEMQDANARQEVVGMVVEVKRILKGR